MWDWDWKKICNKHQVGKKKKNPPWTSMDSREENENNDLHLLVPFLEVNQLTKGYVATRWQQKAEPRSVSLVPWCKAWSHEGTEGFCGKQNVCPSRVGGNAL